MAKKPIVRFDTVPIREREMLRAAEAATLFFGKGRSTWYSWLRDELIPRPVKLPNGNNYWRRIELLDWCASGCPPASRWRWTPARLPTYERLVQEVAAELAGLQDEKADLEREVVELRALADRLRR